MAYAVATTVSVDKTQTEIRKLVTKAGAVEFATYESSSQAQLAFQLGDRRIRFALPLPTGEGSEAKRQQALRSRWRALLLVIKAKLESVDSKIETIEEAFLANIITTSGRTVYEEVKGPLLIHYQEKRNVPLLEGPKS